MVNGPPGGSACPIRIGGHLTTRSKLHAKRPFRSPLPLGSTLKEGCVRETARIYRLMPDYSKTFVYDRFGAVGSCGAL
jgi:hypothetical protein